MNAVEIEEAISALAEQAAFDSAEFPYAFLQAFGNKETTIKRLRSGASNKSDLGGVLQTNNIHIAVALPGEVTKTLTALKASPATARAKARFILAADGSDFEAEEGVRHFRYVRDMRAKIAPIRDLLVRMENIIGDECYNDNIQNYSSWGVWEGEGRSFRYPVTVLRGDNAEKRKFRFDDLLAEELVTGHYKFGANELSIYRALIKIVDMLESDYGLKVPRS